MSSGPYKSVFRLQRRLLHIFKKYGTNINTHIHIITHSYEYTYAHFTPMNISERLIRLDLEIHEVGHQKHLDVDGDIASY
jgi:hypothetical protein